MPAEQPAVPRHLVDKVQEIAEPFDQWLTENGVPARFEQLREPLLAGVAIMSELGGASVTAWTPQTLSATLDLFEAELPEEEFATLNGALGLTLGFLLDTDRWRGSLGDGQACLELLTDVDDVEFEQLLTAVAEQFPAPAEEAEALTQLPAVVQALRVLAWLGSGRSVTPSGNIRPKDLPEAAAELGIVVRVAKKPPAPDQGAFDLIGVAEVDPSARLVRGMPDVPELASAWQVLLESGLIQRKNTTATPTALGQAVSGADLALRVAALRQLASADLQQPFNIMARTPQIGFVASLLISLLGAACQEEPVARDKWDQTITEALSLMFAGPAVEFEADDDVLDDDDFDDDEFDDEGESLVFALKPVVDQQTEQLQLHGFLVEGPDGLTVPAPLRSMVAQTLLHILDEY